MSREKAKAVLEQLVHGIVAENNVFIRGAVEACRTERKESKASRLWCEHYLEAAKECRSQNRQLLAAIEVLT